MIKVHPYLNFPGNAEEAFKFYQSVFGGELQIVRFRDFPDNGMGVAEKDLDKMANIALPLSESSMLMATDVVEGWAPLNVGNHSYIALDIDSAEEAERIFDALSAGGRVDMPLQQTEWAEKYSSFADRFGVQWMVMYTGSVQFTAGQTA